MRKLTLTAVLFTQAVCAEAAAPTYDELKNSSLDWPTAQYESTYAANLSASAPASAASDPVAAVWAAFVGASVGAGFGTQVACRQSVVCPWLDGTFRPGALLFIR